MQREEDIQAAIERVLAGDASEQDEQLVAAWAREDAANEAELRRLEAAWQIASSSGRDYDSAAAWSQLKSRLAPDASPSSSRAERGTGRLMMWAAVIALLLVGGAIGRLVVPGALESPDLIARDVVTGVGEVMTVQLGDGSVVVLGPRSTLSESEGVAGERRVALTGSAYFEVAHDPAHPFVVSVGAAEARVLGTTFTVTGYPDGTSVETAVESGRVSMRADASQEPVVLTAGQLGRLESDGSVSVTRVDVSSRLAWRSGALTFDGTSLRDVAAVLERWYRVDVVIADSSIASYPLTATFSGAPVSEVLDVVSRTLGIRHTFDGVNVEFHP